MLNPRRVSSSVVRKVHVLPKYDSSTDLFPHELIVVTFSWCSSVKILLPGLARIQQLHSSAIAEPTHPSRKDRGEDRAPLVEWGNSTCSHWKTALSQVLEEEKNTSARSRLHTAVLWIVSGGCHLVVWKDVDQWYRTDLLHSTWEDTIQWLSIDYLIVFLIKRKLT